MGTDGSRSSSVFSIAQISGGFAKWRFNGIEHQTLKAFMNLITVGGDRSLTLDVFVDVDIRDSLSQHGSPVMNLKKSRSNRPPNQS